MSNLLQQALLKTAAPEPDPRDTANILRHNEAILSYRRGTAKSNFDTLEFCLKLPQLQLVTKLVDYLRTNLVRGSHHQPQLRTNLVRNFRTPIY